MAGEVFTGVMGGAGTGASIGSTILPGWGTAIGAVAGGIWGGVSASGQVADQKEALERLEAIPSFDPMQLNFLDQLKREKRSVESGFTTDFQVAKDLNKQALAGGYSVAEKVGATNPALAISMSRRAGAQYNTGINQALGTISTRGHGLTSSMGELINRISQRRLDLEVLKTSQQLGMATSSLQTSQTNAAQFAARLPQYAGEIKEGAGQIGGAIGAGAGAAWGGVNSVIGAMGRSRIPSGSGAFSSPYYNELLGGGGVEPWMTQPF